MAGAGPPSTASHAITLRQHAPNWQRTRSAYSITMIITGRNHANRFWPRLTPSAFRVTPRSHASDHRSPATDRDAKAAHHPHDRKNSHSAKEYARGKGDALVTSNSIAGFFGFFKRGMVGVYQHRSEAHLQRYPDEFSFGYSNRSRLGIEDAERAVIAMKGGEGKRLTWRRTDEA